MGGVGDGENPPQSGPASPHGVTTNGATNTGGIGTRERMFAAFTGAAITAFTMTPFDVVKVRQQDGRTPGKMIKYCNGLMDHMMCCRENRQKFEKTLIGQHCFDEKHCMENGKCVRVHNRFYTNQLNKHVAKPWYLRCPVPQSTFHAMVSIARTEGIPTLWSGLPATIFMALPATVAYFTAYEELRDHFLPKYGSFWAPCFAGGLARFCTNTIISPIELIRTRMQIDGLSWRQMHKVLSSALRQNGVKSLYLGYGSTLARDVPFSAVYFFSYEFFKSSKIFMELSPEDEWMKDFSSAAAAGAIAGTLTLPMDVIKTQQQMMLGSKMSEPISMFKVYKNIIERDGRFGLVRGFSPRLLKIVPACAIMMTTYQYFKRYYSTVVT